MASFDITAQINLRGPTNVKKIAADIRKQLSGVTTGNVQIKIDPKTQQTVVGLNRSFQQFNKTLQQTSTLSKNVSANIKNLGAALNQTNNTAKTTNAAVNQLTTGTKQLAVQTKKAEENAKKAATGFFGLGRSVADSFKNVLKFRIASNVINLMASAIQQGVSNFIEYERALAKVQQVTLGTNLSIESLSRTIQNTAISTGVAASELAKVSVTLSQAGLSAKETATALEALAKTNLAPTFGDINDTAEGGIAILRQFKLEANQLEAALGSINAVAGAFAVSSSDVITAVKQAGAVFASSSKDVAESDEVFRQFIATFTSVRQTTRESAETIGTGLKTIITRLQRLDTIEALKKFNIQLTDSQGKFVGAYKAIQLLAEGLEGLDTRDIRFGALIEELGGFRQVGKVIPLIKEAAVARKALTVASEGQNSIDEQAIIAQQTLGFELDKTANAFQKLITTISNDSAIQKTIKGILQLVQGVLALADALKDVIPVLVAIGASAGLKALSSFTVGAASSGLGKLFGANQGGSVPQTLAFARGGYVPGSGNRDTVPAMLTPGEFVIRKKAVQAIGVNKLGSLNEGGSSTVAQAKNMGGRVQKFANGGEVAVDYVQSKPDAATEKQLIGNNIINSINNLANYFSPEAKNLSERANPKNVVPNYSGMVGGIFEKAVELVAGVTVPKSQNNQVWDYPAGLGDTELFNYVPSLNRPTDAKNSVNSNAVIDKKLQAHYNNAKGSEKLRTKFGIVVFDEGTDYDYTFDPSYFKERALDKDSVKKKRGGLIQKFVDGGEAIPIAKSGRIKKKDLAEATTPQLEQLLKNPAVIGNASTTQAINSELAKRGKEAKAEKLGVVGILPINYSKDLAPADYGGTFAKIYARGLPQKYEETVLNISKGLRGVVDEAARGLGEDNPQALSPEQEKATGLENVQGTVFEAVLSALGAKGGSVQNQAIDYQNGLGPAARIFPGIGPNWPTEVKRDVTGAGMSRAKGEFARYFKENAQNKSIGGMIQRFAAGGRVNDKSGLKIKTTGGNTITSTFEGGQTSSGEVVAKSIGKNLFAVIAAQASGGGGRALYDAAMKQATRQGGSLVSDRSRVSAAALERIWTTYYGTGKSKTGQTVGRRPVPEDMLYTGAFFKDSDFPSPDPSSWQGRAVPLQYAYQQFADGGGVTSGEDTVPAMLTPGEYVINKKAAKQIGLAKLNQMNYADRVQGYNKGGAVGPIQYFTNGGSPNTNPSVAFANMGGSLGTQAAKTQAQASKNNLQASKNMLEASDKQSSAAEDIEDASKKESGQQGFAETIGLSLIGPAIEQAILTAFPRSEFAAGVGEAASQFTTASQTTKTSLQGVSGILKSFGGKWARFGKLVEKGTGAISTLVGGFFGLEGYVSGKLRKSIELLAEESDQAGQKIEDAFTQLPALLADGKNGAAEFSSVLKNGAQEIADSIKIQEQIRQKQVESNSGGITGSIVRGLGLESDEQKSLREAKNNQVNRQAFAGPAQAAEETLISIVNSGRDLDTAFKGNEDALMQMKTAIALTDIGYQKEKKRLDELIANSSGEEQKQYKKELEDLTNATFKERGGRVAAAIALQEAKKASEESRKALAKVTTSLERYISNFGAAIDQASFAFEKLAKETESIAAGFGGVTTDNLFADNQNKIENPERFSRAENESALKPLEGILGENLQSLKQFTTLSAKIEQAILRGAASGAETGPQAAEIIGNEVSAAITAQFGDNNAFGQAISNRIQNLIETQIGESGDGSFSPEDLIKKTKDILDNFGEEARKALGDAYTFIGETFDFVAKQAEQAAIATSNFTLTLQQSAISNAKLSAKINEQLSEVRRPRSIQDITSTSVGGLSSNVDSAGDYQAQLLSIQQEQTRLMVEKNKLERESITDNGARLSQVATEIGKNNGELQALQNEGKALQAGLQDKLGELQSELGNRLGQLRQQQGAAESLFERALKDERGTNQEIARALTIAQGGSVGQLTGDEAVGVLRDIKQLQAAGIIENTKALRENLVKGLSSARGLGGFTDLGDDIISKFLGDPAEDDQVKAYVSELKNTNVAIQQLNNSFAVNELINKNDALISSQTALISSITNLDTTLKQQLAKDEQASGVKQPKDVESGATNKARGGMIYRSSGGDTEKRTNASINWQPRGSDTVPAMLTPGEFVVNAKATSRNRGLLEAINSGGTPSVESAAPALSRGGVLYRSEGGGTEGDSYYQTLSEALTRWTQGARGFTTFFRPDQVVPEWMKKVGNVLPDVPELIKTWNLKSPMFAKGTEYIGQAYDTTKYLTGFKEGKGFPLWMDDFLRANPGLTISDMQMFHGKGPNFWQKLGKRAFGSLDVTKLSDLAIDGFAGIGNAFWNKIGNFGGMSDFFGGLMAKKAPPVFNWMKSTGNFLSGRVASGGLGAVGLGEQVMSGWFAGKNRYQELRDQGAYAQAWYSGVAEFLAGGTSPVNDYDFETKDGKVVGSGTFSYGAISGVLSAGSGNILRMLSAMASGYDVGKAVTRTNTGGLAGAALAGGAVVVGQTLRLAEEVVGLAGDTYESYASERSAGRTEDNLNEKVLTGGNVPSQLEDYFKMLGSLQFTRAKGVGKKGAEHDWYTKNKGKFEAGMKYGEKVDFTKTGLASYVDSKWVDAFQSTTRMSGEAEFNPNLIPQNQTGISGLFNGYSKSEIQGAYKLVRSYYQTQDQNRIPYTDTHKNEQTSPPVLDTAIKTEGGTAQLRKNKLFGDPKTGLPADPSVWENDAKLKEIYKKGTNIYNIRANWLKRNIKSSDGFDDTGARETDFLNMNKNTTDGLLKNKESWDKRQEEILRELEAAEQKKDEEKKREVDAKSLRNKNIKDVGLNIDAITNGDVFKTSEKAPYIIPTSSLILKGFQQPSLDMRNKLGAIPTLLPDSKDGPLMSSYLNWRTGDYADNDDLIKTESERDYWRSIGNGILKYRENYRLSSPLWNKFTTEDPAYGELAQLANGTPAQRLAFREYMNPDRGGATRKNTNTVIQEILGKAATSPALQLTEEELKLTPDEQKEILDKKYNKVIAAALNAEGDSKDPVQKMFNKIAFSTGKLAGNTYEKIKGANFYAEGYPNTKITAGQGFDVGKAAMAEKLGDTAPRLYPDLNQGKGMQYGSLVQNYVLGWQELLSKRGNVFNKKDQFAFNKIRADEEKQAEVALDEQTKRLRAVANYSKLNLVGKPFPKSPIEYIEFRQDQSKAFATAVQGTEGESYPMPTDLPGFKQGGVAEKWVKKLFTLKDSDFAYALSQGTAEALLRWKSKFGGGGGEFDAEQWIAKAQQVDGAVNLSDIYTNTPAGEGGAKLAAEDLSKIQTKGASVSDIIAGIKTDAQSDDASSRRQLEKAMVQLKTAGLWSADQDVGTNLKSLSNITQGTFEVGPLARYLKLFDEQSIYSSDRWRQAKAVGLATGGVVPTSVFTPRGTDTVPAMLTPGEYVVNKKAAQANKPLLEAINGKRSRNPKSQYYNDGGNVGNNGVNNIVAIDVQEISNFVTSFDRFSKELANLNIPSEITLQGTHTVDVNINGAQVLNDLLNGPIGDMVASEVELAFQRQNIESEGSVPNPFA